MFMSMDKAGRYERVLAQVRGYVHTTTDVWARLATMVAVLHHKMPHFFWTGVYALSEGELVARLYQGQVACQKLGEAGVCWTAVREERTLIVGNVDEFPGHIACNPASRSEIVIPIRDREGRVFACLDVDSDRLDAFDEADEVGLKGVLSLLFD
jgi:GAF domain-containing protein